MHLNRREFVRHSASGLIAAAAGRPFALLGQARRAEMRHLRRNVGIFIDRGGTIGWLNTLNGCAVVDSQFPDAAENFLVELREIGGRPVHALINTHHHADHTSGNGALKYVVRQLVAHENSLKNQRNYARERSVESEQTYPDFTFADSVSLQVGDEVVRAKYYGPAHTDGDVTVFFQNADIVHLGDLVNNRAYPNIDGPAGASVHGWIRALEAIADEHGSETLYVFGHGEAAYGVTGDRADLLYQRDYFSAVLETAERALGEGRSREETIATTSIPGFTGLGGSTSRLALALGIAYDELRNTRDAR